MNHINMVHQSCTIFYFKQDRETFRLIIHHEHYEPFWVRIPIEWINYPTPKFKDNGLVISKPKNIVFHIICLLLFTLPTTILLHVIIRPGQWTDQHANMIRKIKDKIEDLPYSRISLCYWEKIIDIRITEDGYKEIIKQINPETGQEYLVRFYFEKWNIQIDHTIQSFLSL